MDEVKLLPCEGVAAVASRLGKSVDVLLSAAEDVQLQAVAAINALEDATRPTLVTDEVVERVAKVIDAATGFYLPRDDVVAAARAAIASMPAIPPQSLGDHALPPSGLSRDASQAKPAAAIARKGK